MKQALSHLLSDLLSAILFLFIYLASGNISLAAAIAIAAGFAQLGAIKLSGRRIEAMQWISLGLVVVLSGAAMLTQSPRFIMVKPSIVHFAIAAVMLRRGWMVRYLPETVRENLPESVPIAAGYAWAGLMAGLGFANLGFASYGDLALWAWFISAGALGAKVVAFIAQYVVFRTMVRRRLAGDPPADGVVMRASSPLLSIVAGLILFGTSSSANAAGFQQLAVPDPEGEPLELAVWYPSDAPAMSRAFGLFRQMVAADGAVSGWQLPLIVISHGTGGGPEGHYDTALALAEAGFIAAAVTHTGDNWRDHAYSFTRRNFVERPRHLKLAIDYLLRDWSGRDHIAAERIGAFGHSAGGFAVLVAIGGEPDLARLTAFCREHPEEWGCQHRRQPSAANAPRESPAPIWVHDPRIKAAVIAAPAAGYAFTPAALAGVDVPVQLWEAEEDRITVNRWHAEIVRTSLPSSPDTHVVPRADHFAFLAPCNAALAERAPEICRDPPGFDRSTFHRAFNFAVAAFFRNPLETRKVSEGVR